jgi:hypothetical protein
MNSPELTKEFSVNEIGYEPIKDIHRINELSGLEFYLTNSMGKMSRGSSKYTVEEPMVIRDCEGDSSPSSKNSGKSRCAVKENSMINSLHQEPSRKSSKSKTKSIGKYTAVKKR